MNHHHSVWLRGPRLTPRIGSSIEMDRGADARGICGHFDGASDDIPARAAILNAKRLSPTGGQTEFSNCYAAWDERRGRRHEPRTYPLVWTHKSGRKSLALGCTASHIEGLTPDVGGALLAELTEWATSRRFVYRREWSLGDLLIWDNTGTMHRVTPYDAESGRVASDGADQRDCCSIR